MDKTNEWCSVCRAAEQISLACGTAHGQREAGLQAYRGGMRSDGRDGFQRQYTEVGRQRLDRLSGQCDLHGGWRKRIPTSGLNGAYEHEQR